MKIGIYFNEAQAGRETADMLVRRVAEAGHTAVVFTQPEEIAQVDRLVVLGGDGTVLRAARRAASLGLPLVGVNFGRLGFLTEFERDEAERAVDLVLEGGSELRRTMLEVGYGGKTAQCLNEVALLRAVKKGRDIRTAEISVTIDGCRAAEMYADGVIVTTPTGSTAYSLSAGGSILTPDCPAFMLTPVCAFSMRSRPIAYADSGVLSFSIPGGSGLLLYGDGAYLGEVRGDDVVTVRRSARQAIFITRNKSDYFRRLTEKIN